MTEGTVNAIERLAQAIGYPDEVTSGCKDYTFAVDDFEVRAQETGGRLRLTASVFTPARDGEDEGRLAELAGYVPGRILKEEAVLAWDPDAESAILWQEYPATAEADDLRRFFEVFTASFEWWRDRASAVQEEAEPLMPEFVIRP